jgi:hypothetical protein
VAQGSGFLPLLSFCPVEGRNTKIHIHLPKSIVIAFIIEYRSRSAASTVA